MDTERVLVVASIIAGFTLLFSVLIPLGRALVKRLEGVGPGDPMELEEIRSRLQSLEAAESRLAELEERLDFAERMLTSGRPSPGAEVDTPPEPMDAGR